jgi:hypothetical protein
MTVSAACCLSRTASADEGHGLVRAANRLDFYSRADQFLAKHLGGRREPFVAQPQSTAKVITEVKSPAAAAATGAKPAVRPPQAAGAAPAAAGSGGAAVAKKTSSNSTSRSG